MDVPSDIGIRRNNNFTGTILSRHTGSITEPDGAMNPGGPGGEVFTPWLSDPTHVLTLYIGAVVDLEIAVAP